MKKPLTDTLIRTIAAPASGRVEFSDERCSGLTFRVTANGVRSWSFRFRDPRSNGLTRATLGTYPALSLAEAREKAIDMRRCVAKGTTWVEKRPTAHDLRRTLATRLAALGIPAEDVKACLNHARDDVTARHYDQYDRLREKRRALELWSEQVQSIIDGAPTSNVISLRPASAS
jgi:hypothetical protein